MKFIYVDESGARDQGDVFVMSGLMVDARHARLRPPRRAEDGPYERDDNGRAEEGGRQKVTYG